jgi:hypothetical protein
MWSARLAQSLRGLGHEPVVLTSMPAADERGEAAIVNLGDRLPPAELVERLHGLGIPVIAHAGHKERELHELGRQAGADRLATNSELTFKLPELLAEIIP